MLKVKKLTKKFGSTIAVNEAVFEVKSGEIFSLRKIEFIKEIG